MQLIFSAVSIYDNMEEWDNFTSEFQCDLRFAIKLRDTGSSMQGLSVNSLEHIHKVLTRFQPLAQSVEVRMADAKDIQVGWREWQDKWEHEKHLFARVCNARQERNNKKLAWELAEAAKVTSEGTKAVSDHDKCFIHVSMKENTLQTGAEITKEFLENVCLNEAAPGTCRQHIPTVVVWDQNAWEGKSFTDPATHLHQHVATLRGILLV